MALCRGYEAAGLVLRRAKFPKATTGEKGFSPLRPKVFDIAGFNRNCLAKLYSRGPDLSRTSGRDDWRLLYQC
jgi:hypothetical protein